MINEVFFSSLTDKNEGRREEKKGKKARKMDGESEEGQRSGSLTIPKALTAKEWEEHMVSHWPFRSWCEHCDRGKAKAELHRATTQTSEIPIVGIDYMWMTSEEDKKEDGDHH